MFDATLRRACGPPLARLAAGLHRRSVGAAVVTVAGLVLGLGAAVAAGLGWWWPALGLWLVSRVLDGLDGAVARIEGPTPRGGFFDIVADFTVYGAFVVGVALERPEARLAAVAVLCTYYVSGAAFLAWSSLAETERAEAGLELDDGRSLRFVGGLAEGFETVVAYAVICLVPDWAEVVLWVFAAMVGVTALQRVRFAAAHLGTEPRS
jgi:phosphatidylserine synthase